MGDRTSASESDQLVEGAAALGVQLEPAVVSALTTYLDLLYEWNSYAGLTAIARGDAVRLHLLDSLALVPFLSAAVRVADLGSGGGLPGIPLALVSPASRVTLIESKRRRCSFLREVARRLDLGARVSILEGDAKAGLPMLRGSQDAVVARAFVPPAELLTLAAPLLSIAGRLALMSGGEDLHHLAETAGKHGLSLESVRTFSLPGGSETRSITVFQAW